jgi:signal transduction histidine kinase
MTTAATSRYPPALTHAELAGALEDMTRRSPIPTTIKISGDLHGLSDEQRATAWFVCSEGLTNVTRQSGASRAAISLSIDESSLLIEIRDDGRGDATPGRGLRGLGRRRSRPPERRR